MGEKKTVLGVVTDLQRFCMHDGPGIRTTVFLKGCPLRCLWCHNPETQKFQPQVQLHSNRCLFCSACVGACPEGCHRIGEEGHVFCSAACTGCFACVSSCLPRALEVCGQEMAVEQVLAEVEKDRVFYGTVGGMTLSGGEPMAQPAFALALLSGAREKGISTCIETSGAFPTKYIPELAANCDFFYYDVKDTDPERHRRNTGASLPRILQNLAALSSLAPRRVTMRCIIIAGINDNDAHLKQLLAIADRCGIEKIDLLPFHPMGSGKYGAVGQEAPVDFGEERIPDKGALEQMRRQITAHFAQRQ